MEIDIGIAEQDRAAIAEGLSRLLADTYASDSLDDRDVAVVLEVMDRTGVREYAKDLASEHCEMALERLATVEMSPEARRDMEEMAHFLLLREH